MKTINQNEIAGWLGVSAPFLSEIKHGVKGLSKSNAYRIAELTGISFERLMFSTGEQLFKMLAMAYTQRQD